MDEVKSDIYYVYKNWRCSGLTTTTITALFSSVVFIIFTTILLVHSKYYVSMWFGLPLLLVYYQALFLITPREKSEAKEKVAFWGYCTIGYFCFTLIFVIYCASPDNLY